MDIYVYIYTGEGSTSLSIYVNQGGNVRLAQAVGIDDLDMMQKRDCYWKPVNSSIHTVQASTVSRIWENLLDAGFDPTEHPRKPEI